MNFYLAVYALGRVAPRHVITFGITKLPYSQDVLPDEKPRMICGLGLPGTQQFNSSCSVAYFAQWMCVYSFLVTWLSYLLLLYFFCPMGVVKIDLETIWS
jgi:hypothetical protein